VFVYKLHKLNNITGPIRHAEESYQVCACYNIQLHLQ